MAQDLDAHKSTEALDEVKDTITRLSDENKELRDKLKICEEKHLDPNNIESSRRLRLTELAARHHADYPVLPEFYGPEDQFMWGLFKDKESEWFNWVDKELHFAKEMRVAYGRVNETGSSATVAAGTAAGKRRRNDATSTAKGKTNQRVKREQQLGEEHDGSGPLFQ